MSFRRIYYLPTRPDFMEDNFKLKVSEASIKAFAQGSPGQGYIGILDLAADKNLGMIHLVPSFNKQDGVLREDKEGKAFPMSADSLTERGTNTGDLHTQCVSKLKLGDKGGEHGLVMGFGVWKNGLCIRILDKPASDAALIPDEFHLLREAKKDWELTYVDDNNIRCPITINSVPGLQAELVDLDPQQVTREKRIKIENLIRAYYQDEFDIDDTPRFKFVKNRSSSMNFFSCQYERLFAEYFRLRHQSHGAHSLDLKREIPLEPFAKLTKALCAGLKIKVIEDLLDDDAVPEGIYGIYGHLLVQEEWSENPDKCIEELFFQLLNSEEGYLALSDIFKEMKQSAAKANADKKEDKKQEPKEFKSTAKREENRADSKDKAEPTLHEVPAELVSHFVYALGGLLQNRDFKKTGNALKLLPPKERIATLGAEDAKGENTLFQAVLNEDQEYIAFCVQQGVNLNAQNHAGETPLQAYLRSGRANPEFVEFLLKLGAKPHSSPIHPPLLGDIQCQDPAQTLATMNLLIKYGAKMDEVDQTQSHILHYLILNHQAWLIGKLAEQKEFQQTLLKLVNQPNAWEETPAHVAALRRDTAAMNQLCILKADFNSRNADGETPVMILANKGAWSDIVHILILHEHFTDTSWFEEHATYAQESLKNGFMTFLQEENNNTVIEKLLQRFLTTDNSLAGFLIATPDQKQEKSRAQFLYELFIEHEAPRLLEILLGLNQQLKLNINLNQIPFVSDFDVMNVLAKQQVQFIQIDEHKKTPMDYLSDYLDQSTNWEPVIDVLMNLDNLQGNDAFKEKLKQNRGKLIDWLYFIIEEEDNDHAKLYLIERILKQECALAKILFSKPTSQALFESKDSETDNFMQALEAGRQTIQKRISPQPDF
jgi:ankyrin repeat protein